jgi:hypothetical protein
VDHQAEEQKSAPVRLHHGAGIAAVVAHESLNAVADVVAAAVAAVVAEAFDVAEYSSQALCSGPGVDSGD